MKESCMKILLADDDARIHLIVGMWLKRNGHDLVSAHNGREALAVLEQDYIDVLVSDVNMPLMTGVELVKSALQSDRCPGLIIMMTSRCDLADLEEEVSSGKVHLFNKPFSPAELIELIEKLITEKAEA